VKTLINIWKFITSFKFECGCSGCKRSNYYHSESYQPASVSVPPRPPGVSLPPTLNLKKCSGNCKDCKNCSK